MKPKLTYAAVIWWGTTEYKTISIKFRDHIQAVTLPGFLGLVRSTHTVAVRIC